MIFKNSDCGYYQFTDCGYTVGKYTVQGEIKYAAFAPKIKDSLAVVGSGPSARRVCEKHKGEK